LLGEKPFSARCRRYTGALHNPAYVIFWIVENGTPPAFAASGGAPRQVRLGNVLMLVSDPQKVLFS
jgi:hypothetical protein